jgi:mono/diheme cytochrome c family protein
VSAPLLVLFLILGSLALAGCGGTRTGCATADDPVVCWKQHEQLPDAALAGARVFVASACLTCHTYVGTGQQAVGAHDLSDVGKKRSVAFLERYIDDPSRYGTSVMPKFADLGSSRVHNLAVFLAASKGTH